MGIFPEGVLFNVLFSGFRAPATFPRVGMLQDRPDIHSQIVLPSTDPTLGEKTLIDEPLPLTFDPSVPRHRWRVPQPSPLTTAGALCCVR